MKFYILGISLLMSSFHLQAEEFPLRSKFPSIPVIEIKELASIYDKAVIVDVRSKFEYDVIHIDKAVLISSSNMSFLPELEKVRAKEGPNLIVFYCNGVKCEKSFDAAKDAIAAGFKNIKVLDAGIFSWCKAQPKMTYLLGKAPADLSKLISDESYKARLVDFDKIKTAANDPNTLIIDVRDQSQKKKELPLKAVRSIPLSRINAWADADPDLKKKNLYFIDSVGKQNEWLQYFLVERGLTNFKFLQGGADSL